MLETGVTSALARGPAGVQDKNSVRKDRGEIDVHRKDTRKIHASMHKQNNNNRATTKLKIFSFRAGV